MNPAVTKTLLMIPVVYSIINPHVFCFHYLRIT